MVASTSQKKGPLSCRMARFRFKTNGSSVSDVPSHCRPAFFICIQCRRHPRLEPSTRGPRSTSLHASPQTPSLSPAVTPLVRPTALRGPTYHRNIVNTAAHRKLPNPGTRGPDETRREAEGTQHVSGALRFAFEFFRVVLFASRLSAHRLRSTNRTDLLLLFPLAGCKKTSDRRGTTPFEEQRVEWGRGLGHECEGGGTTTTQGDFEF